MMPFAVFLLACAQRAPQPSSEIVVDASFAPQPAHIGPATVSVVLTDPAAKPVSQAHVTLEANMTHPGMAPIFREAREVSPGRYQADLELGMRGDWVILLHVRLANGQKLERQMAIQAK
jgi:hypothetical protein